MKLKTNKKGFTLVEIIIVLVIMAILAAVAIPSMVGFVNKAKGEKYIAEARSALVAAQAIATEKFASGAGGTVSITEQEIIDLISDSAMTVAACEITATCNNQGKVTQITYKRTGDDKTVTIVPPNAAVIS